MTVVKIVGAILLISGCGSFGFLMGAQYRTETRILRWLLASLQEMEWELKYRLTPLPDLLGIAASTSGGIIRELFLSLKQELESGSYTEISGCMNGLLQRMDIPYRSKKCLRNLGKSLGRYDLEGQLQSLETVRYQCKKDLEELDIHRAERLRSYHTLALCSGIALAILFL